VASFDRTIPPGGVGKIALSVTTQGQHGDIRVRTRVYSNDPKNKQITLTLKAFVKAHKQVETPPSLEQVPGQGPAGLSSPPGGGPNLPSQGPPGAEKQTLPPPLLPQDTEVQVSPQPEDQNRVPDANLSGPPDVHNMNPGPVS